MFLFIPLFPLLICPLGEAAKDKPKNSYISSGDHGERRLWQGTGASQSTCVSQWFEPLGHNVVCVYVWIKYFPPFPPGESIWSPADFVCLPTDKEMTRL